MLWQTRETSFARQLGQRTRRLKKLFNAKLIKKLDGFDQKYRDFEMNDKIVVLHSDSMVGISIHIEDGSGEGLLREIAKVLQN